MFSLKIKNVLCKTEYSALPHQITVHNMENIPAREAIDAEAHGFVVGGRVATTLPASTRQGHSLTTQLLEMLDVSNLSSITVSRSHT
jgi:beta-glucosidase-like glycosyl hydrolase